MEKYRLKNTPELYSSSKVSAEVQPKKNNEWRSRTQDLEMHSQNSSITESRKIQRNVKNEYAGVQWPKSSPTKHIQCRELGKAGEY